MTTKVFKSSFLIVVVFQLILSLFGCKMDRRTDAIDLEANHTLSVFDVFSEIKLIKLKTNPDNLIGLISQVVYHKEKFYLLDIRTQQIFCFDQAGRFKFKISAQGRGPGEYHYITHLNIDTFNEQLLVLDSFLQRVLVFSLDGEYVQTEYVAADKSLGLNKVFALNSKYLLLSALNDFQLIFYCRESKEVFHKDFPYPLIEGVIPFIPMFNVYQQNHRTYALPVFDSKVYDVTEINPDLHFYWQFGKHDNSEFQTKLLLEELSAKGPMPYKFHHELVGPGKFLHHYIYKVAETSRFHIAVLEFDSDWMQVVVDKKSGENFVFRSFDEGIVFTFLNIQDNLAIAIENGHEERVKATPGFENRVSKSFHPDLLTLNERTFLENHNPMTDNPFLVVYKFRE